MPQDRIRTNRWKLYRERYKLKIRKDFLTLRAVKQRKQPISWNHGCLIITEDFQTDVDQPFDWDGLRIPPLYRSYSRRHPSSLSTLHCYGFIILYASEGHSKGIFFQYFLWNCRMIWWEIKSCLVY